MTQHLIWFLFSLATGLLGVWLSRAYALKRNWLDIPNERSFHKVPVPRIGGIGMLVPVILLIPACLSRGGEGGSLVWLLALLPALAVAAVSFIDDRYDLPRLIRFGGHTVGGVFVIFILREAWMGGTWPLLGIGLPAWISAILLLVWIAGLTNAYNFMDGIDSIAAVQGLVAVFGWLTVLGVMHSGHPVAGEELILLGLAGGLAAFLVFNWAPASIFMGDVGSTFLGFFLASFPLLAAQTGLSLERSLEAGVLFTWPFIFDTGMTFFRRLVRRERVFDAHRSHLYQVLAGTFASRRNGHRTTSLLFGLLALLGVALYWTSGPVWAKLAVLAGVWVAVTAWTFGIRLKKEEEGATSNSTVGFQPEDHQAPHSLPFPTMPFEIFLSPPEISDAEHRMVEAALASGFIAPVGPQVNAFEAGLSEYLGLPEIHALSSGTAAIHLGLRALGVSPGDCVLCPDLTFVASVNPVRYLGAEPVLVDVHPDSWSMDPSLAREAVRALKSEGRTIRAMVVVHAYGIPAKLEELLKLAREEGIAVLEDCAGAFGSRIGNQSVGSFGDAAAFSFNGNKVLTTSGGGALYIRDPELRITARSWANQGKRPGAVGYFHDSLGYNYKLSNISAAIGIAQLETLSGRLSRKKALFLRYQELLGDIPGLRFMPTGVEATSNYWMTCVGLDDGKGEEVIAALRKDHIEASPIWMPMHSQKVNSELRCFGGKVSENINRTFLSLPSGSSLSTSDQDRVCRVVRNQLLVAS